MYSIVVHIILLLSLALTLCLFYWFFNIKKVRDILIAVAALLSFCISLDWSIVAWLWIPQMILTGTTATIIWQGLRQKKFF